jgi:hypothetical protein
MVGEVTLWSVPEGIIFTIAPSVPNEMVYSLAFSKAGDKWAAVFENEIMVWGVPSELASSFYVHAMKDNNVNSKPLPEATANDIPLLRSPANGVVEDHLSLDQATALSPFPLFIPAHLPENISFLDAMVNKDGSVWLRYVTYHQQSYESLLYIYEKIIGNSTPPTMTIGASAEVLLTRIETASGRENAEYVRGDWILSQGITPPTEDSLSGEVIDVWQWDNSSHSQRLRWHQNGILIAMYYQVNQPYKPVLNEPAQNPQTFVLSTLLTKGDLEQIASGMMPFAETKGLNSCTASTGQKEIDFSNGIDSKEGGSLCLPTLQRTQHYTNNGAWVTK